MSTDGSDPSSTSAHERQLRAPQLRETADIWWDSGSDPLVCWDQTGRRFWLADGAGAQPTLRLVDLPRPAADPIAVAAALRDGLASCDFPPTEDGVPAHRASTTLRVAGIQV